MDGCQLIYHSWMDDGYCSFKFNSIYDVIPIPLFYVRFKVKICLSFINSNLNKYIDKDKFHYFILICFQSIK